MSGRLFVCSTPIGNLEDVSLRLLRVLGEADIVAVEDTRRTRKLLSHYGKRARLVSIHEHNERAQIPFLIERLRGGADVALVSDAGTPAISDPGYLLIQACIEAGIPLEVVPGPSSVLAALVVSGLPIGRFCFEGFLPRKKGEQTSRLKVLAGDDRPVVVFEAPNRVRETLRNVHAVLGDRPMAFVRELTKVHEEVIRGTVSEVLSMLPDEIPGEVVLVIGTMPGTQGRQSLSSAAEFAADLVREGLSKSRAAAEAAASFKVPRRDVYEALLKQD